MLSAWGHPLVVVVRWGGRVCVVWSKLGGGGELVSGVVAAGGGLGRRGFHGGSVAW